MPQLTYLDRQIAYREEGSGPPVVLLHAGGASGRQWRKTIALLDEQFHAVAPDLWGFGETEAWPGSEDLSHDHQASLVTEVLDAAGLGTVHLVGHSYGGATAARLALRTPDRVESLVLIEPILTPLLELAGEREAFDEYLGMVRSFLQCVSASRPESAWKGFLDYRNGPGTWADLAPPAKARFLAVTESTVVGFRSNLNTPTTLEELASLSPPTLVLCGERTTVPDRKVTEILREHIPGCRYRIIPGADHMSPLSHPELIATAIREHVGSPR